MKSIKFSIFPPLTNSIVCDWSCVHEMLLQDSFLMCKKESGLYTGSGWVHRPRSAKRFQGRERKIQETEPCLLWLFLWIIHLSRRVHSIYNKPDLGKILMSFGLWKNGKLITWKREFSLWTSCQACESYRVDSKSEGAAGYVRIEILPCKGLTPWLTLVTHPPFLPPRNLVAAGFNARVTHALLLSVSCPFLGHGCMAAGPPPLAAW